tara:strand:+ start:3394 stop:4524 length:1131 start_codon:yes stop_codon:yes gene_type:complete
MANDNVDVSSDLSSLLGELSKIKKEEDKSKQKKVEELNNDVSFASMMAELSQVAKNTKKKKLLVEPKKKKEKEVTTKEDKIGLLSQLSQLAKDTKKEESYEIGKDYADHTKEVTPGQEKPKKKRAKRKSVDTVEHRQPETTEAPKTVSPIIDLTTKELSKNKSLKEEPELNSLEEMKKEFQKFKTVVTQQMSTIGGGGEVNLRKLDDVDDSSKANGFALKYNSSTDKFDFGEVASDLSAVDQDIIPDGTGTRSLGSASKRFKDIFLAGQTINLGGATISSDGTGTIAIAATGATLPAGSKAGDNQLAVVSTGSAGAAGQVSRVIPFFSASGGLSTANTNFEFNAIIDEKFVFTGTKTFTLANGSALADSDPTLFQF